jgi:hypothetical protein
MNFPTLAVLGVLIIGPAVGRSRSKNHSTRETLRNDSRHHPMPSKDALHIVKPTNFFFFATAAAIACRVLAGGGPGLGEVAS